MEENSGPPTASSWLRIPGSTHPGGAVERVEHGTTRLPGCCSDTGCYPLSL